MQDPTDDDDDKGSGSGGPRKKDFDCPDCGANNPYEDGFGQGDEVRCYYCGLEFKVEVRDDGKFKYREI